MAGYWKLSSCRRLPGTLDRQKKFFGTCNTLQQRLRAMQVSVPMEVDAGKAADNVGSLASAAHARSLELWWDGTRQHHLDVMLVTDSNDVANYANDFKSVYPGVRITPYTADRNTFWPHPPVPDWFLQRAADSQHTADAGSRCRIFDVAYRHGHFAAALDTRATYDMMTQLAKIIQGSSHAWIQFVFQKYSFGQNLQALTSIMRAKYREMSGSDTYIALADKMFSSEIKGGPHPEKNGDFATHYNMLSAHVAQKMQGEHVMLSIRGMYESPQDIELDFSQIQSVSMPGGGARGGYEHLMSNQYQYESFANAEITIWDSITGRRQKIRKDGIAMRSGNKNNGTRVHYSGASVSSEDTAAYDDITSRIRAAISTKESVTPADASKKGRPRLKKGYRRLSIFEYRLLPDPGALSRHVNRYVGTAFWGLLGARYHRRQSPPFLLTTASELRIFLRLPDAAQTPYLSTARGLSIPQQYLAKRGLRMGYLLREKAKSYGISNAKNMPCGNDAGTGCSGPSTTHANGSKSSWFGRIVQASEEQAVVLSKQDISTHMYMVGATKSGKTTLIRCIAKHMEMANLHDTFENAFVFIDPKGSDSYDLLSQCEAATYDKGRVMFLDPIETKFSINVLELPPYGRIGDVIHGYADAATASNNGGNSGRQTVTPEILAQRRQILVSQYVGYVMQMIKYWYQGSETFVRLNRILDTLLQYIYLQNDKPTFLDLYEIIIMMQKDGKEMLGKMFRELGRPADHALEQAIKSVASMDKMAYEPALNRLEKFATDPILRHMFCVRESTVRFEDMIKPGAFAVIRLSQTNIPPHVIKLAKQTLVVKLWFAIQERADRIKTEAERTQVLLALDEFQDVADLPVIEAMLTQARSYGLGLLLAHQTTAQLSNELFEIVTSNVGTQFAGRTSSKDAGRLADAWEPKKAKELKEDISAQEYEHWTVRLLPEENSQQQVPIQFWPVYTPKDVQTPESVRRFIKSQKARYGQGRVGASAIKEAESKSNRWLVSIPYEPPSKDEWHILCLMAEADAPLRLKQITAMFQNGTTASDAVAEILKQMVRKKMLQKGGTSTAGNKNAYFLPHAVRQKYLKFNPADVGTSVDIPLVVKCAVGHYLKRGSFVCMANQTIKRGRLRTDLVAYDYDNDTPISVEIESAAEVNRHPEHVKLNMTKWRDLGFAKCDAWSTNPKIVQIYDKMTPAEKKGVRVFWINVKNDQNNGSRAGKKKKNKGSASRHIDTGRDSTKVAGVTTCRRRLGLAPSSA